jgi:hypothetical protein
MLAEMIATSSALGRPISLLPDLIRQSMVRQGCLDARVDSTIIDEARKISVPGIVVRNKSASDDRATALHRRALR